MHKLKLFIRAQSNEEIMSSSFPIFQQTKKQFDNFSTSSINSVCSLHNHYMQRWSQKIWRILLFLICINILTKKWKNFPFSLEWWMKQWIDNAEKEASPTS